MRKEMFYSQEWFTFVPAQMYQFNNEVKWMKIPEFSLEVAYPGWVQSQEQLQEMGKKIKFILTSISTSPNTAQPNTGLNSLLLPWKEREGWNMHPVSQLFQEFPKELVSVLMCITNGPGIVWMPERYLKQIGVGAACYDQQDLIPLGKGEQIKASP